MKKTERREKKKTTKYRNGQTKKICFRKQQNENQRQRSTAHSSKIKFEIKETPAKKCSVYLYRMKKEELKGKQE